MTAAFRSFIAVGALAFALPACGSDAAAEPEPPSEAGADVGIVDPADCALEAAGIEVAERDLAGYPPYAVAGCLLVYVAASSGALVFRDLATGDELELAEASGEPRRPALAGTLVAWEETHDGSDVVRYTTSDAAQAGTPAETVTGPFVRAGEPRVSPLRIVFTGWLSDADDADTDVFALDTTDGSLVAIADGAGQQRFADVSASHVAVSDFSEDPGGVYRPDGSSIADLVVFDLHGSVRRLQREGKQAFPALGSGRVAFLDWTEVHPVPKLDAYALLSLDVESLFTGTPEEPLAIAQIETEPPHVRPSAAGDSVAWVQRQGGQATLWRAPLDGSSAPEAVKGLDGLDLYAPAETFGYTLLAARAGTATPSLRGVPY